jgi:hypothetical protein
MNETKTDLDEKNGAAEKEALCRKCRVTNRRADELPKRVQTAISELAELEATVTLTPIQLLGVMMKVVLEDRITSQEIDRICTAYYYAMQEASRL